MDVEKYISDIDTARFGFKIAKINDFDSDIGMLLTQFKKSGIKLIISRINSGNIKLINELEDFNFRIKDTQLTVSHNMENTELLFDEFSKIKDVIIQEAQENDVDDVANLSFNSFRGYGHYAADNRMDIEKSNDIYKDWARRSCIDKKVADYMFVAKVGNKVVGFLSLKIERENEKIFGIQHLGAVDKNYRNYNVFRLLILKCLMNGIESKHDWQQSFLLSTNYPVLRSYLKLGFKISGSNHTLHCWL